MYNTIIYYIIIVYALQVQEQLRKQRRVITFEMVCETYLYTISCYIIHITRVVFYDVLKTIKTFGEI